MVEKERMDKLLTLLDARNAIKINELQEELFASYATVRRDLVKLEKKGLIQRNNGKVWLISNKNRESSHQMRENEQMKEKEFICNIAQRFITNGHSLFMDSSTTVNKLCPHLKDKNLLVVTNGLNNALALNEAENILVYTTGGQVKKNSTSIIGEMAADFLNNFKADLAFISCSGLNLEGIYDTDLNQALIKQKMIQNANKVILLCDDNKFDTSHFFKLTTFDEIHTIITNKKPHPDYEKKISQHDCNLIYSHLNY